jgi:molybdopterin molybdotransferase
MITVKEASTIVSEHLPRFGTAEVFADRDYPPFNRVMMDGIALSFDEYHKGLREFPVRGVCAAGEPQVVLKDGCLEVMTGAPLPSGADLVIQYEHLEIKNGVAKILVEVPRAKFDSVHLMGSDCRKGDKVLEKNLPWSGPHIGIAASMGESFQKTSPKVLIISTGDELVEVNPLPHQIRRSNAYALKKSLIHYGYTNVKMDHVNDDPLAVARHYEENSPSFDMMIYSGGVSKGKFDYLPNVWTELGVERLFHEVSQRPGKPLWFGKDEKRNTLVVGLPGNPVSSLVCLHRYFLNQREMTVKLAKEITFKKPLTYFLPVKINFTHGEVWATPLEIKNSGEFTALAGSDGFIELPKDQDLFQAGEVFTFFSWRPL